MTDNTLERRYTEQEFALILRRAIELEAPREGSVQRASPPSLPPEGLTLPEIQQIASEVGIDPARVREAADSIATPEWTPVARFFGGPGRMGAERSVPRQLGREEMASLLNVARDVLKREGQAREVLGGVEWRSRGDFTWVFVRVTPEGEASRVSLAVDRRGMAFLSHWLPFLGGGFLAGVTLAVLEPTAWQAIAAVVSGGIGGGYVVGRTIWSRTTRKWKGLVDEAMARMMARIRSPSSAEELTAGEAV